MAAQRSFYLFSFSQNSLDVNLPPVPYAPLLRVAGSEESGAVPGADCVELGHRGPPTHPAARIVTVLRMLVAPFRR